MTRRKYKPKHPEEIQVEAILVDLHSDRDGVCKFLEGYKYFFNDSKSIVIVEGAPNIYEGAEVEIPNGVYLVRGMLGELFHMRREDFELFYETID